MEKSKDSEAILASNADLRPHGVALGAYPISYENSVAEKLVKNAKKELLNSKPSNKSNLTDKSTSEVDGTDKASGLSPWQKQLAGLMKKRAQNLKKAGKPESQKNLDHYAAMAKENPKFAETYSQTLQECANFSLC